QSQRPPSNSCTPHSHTSPSKHVPSTPSSPLLVLIPSYPRKSSSSSASTSSHPSPPTSSTNLTLHSTATKNVSSAQNADRTTNTCMETTLGNGIIVVAFPASAHSGSSIDDNGSKTTFPVNPLVSSGRGRGKGKGSLVRIIRYGGWLGPTQCTLLLSPEPSSTQLV
ncbi:hypothetical protein PQX77_022069, partial [Marasmius sp. AFHP31]